MKRARHPLKNREATDLLNNQPYIILYLVVTLIDFINQAILSFFIIYLLDLATSKLLMSYFIGHLGHARSFDVIMNQQLTCLP